MGTIGKPSGSLITEGQLVRASGNWPPPQELPDGRVRGSIIDGDGVVIGYYEHAAGFDPFAPSDGEKTSNSDQIDLGSEPAGTTAGNSERDVD